MSEPNDGKKDKGKRKKKKKKKKDWKFGYDDGLFVKSPDRNYNLKLTGMVQVRYVFNLREEDGGFKTRSDLEARRVKIKAAGRAFGDWFKYSATVARHRTDNSITLESMWGRFDLTKNLTLKIGRFRPPLLREESVSPKRQLAAERSLIATTFRQKRTEGIGMAYQEKKWRVRGGVFQTSQDLLTDEFLFVTARAEFLARGKWKRLRDFTSFPDDKPVIAFGVGLAYRYVDRADTQDTDSNVIRWTTDVSVELGGVNAMAAIVGNHLSEEGEPARDQFGLVVHGGVFVTKSFELFARYEWGDADGAAPDLSVATVGFNSYFNRHRVKFTADVGYGLGEVDDFWATSAAGWRDDDTGESGQIVVRAQLQVLF